MVRPVIAVTILACALAARLAYQEVFRAAGESVPLRIPFQAFNRGGAGEGWSEESQPLDQKALQKVGVTEYINRFFEKEKVPIWFYVGYYDGKRVDSIHQPEVCFPGGGWKAEEKRVEELKVGGFGEIPFNIIRFKKPNERKLAGYTFFYRGKFVAKQSAVEWGRVFGAKNYAILTVAADFLESETHAQKLMVELLERLLPKLLEHFPAGPVVEKS